MKSAHFKISCSQTIRCQSVKAHLEETAALSEQFAAKIKMPKTGRLLGILHDSGKFSHAYQTYLDECKQFELGKISAPPRKGSVDHGIFGAVYVMEELRDKKNVISEIVAEILAMVIASHHGGLRDFLGLDASTPLWNRIEKYGRNKKEEYESIKEEFEKNFPQKDVRELFSEAVLEMEGLKRCLPNFTPFQMHLVIKFLYSCLIDSDREDTRLFMEGIEEKSETDRGHWKDYERRLEYFLGKLREKTPETMSEKRIKELREEISEACYQAGGWPAGVYKLTVPTGGGKTLASMRMALRHMEAKEGTGSGRILQVLPYTSIIEQNAAVVREVLQCEEELLEHHSNVMIEAKEEEEHNLSSEQYRLLTERWNSPFIFTTTVQFLNTVYASGTQNIRRMHNLAESVIIMDEVQALPLKTMKLFGELVNFLYYACNTTFLLCTATQPDLEDRSIGIHAQVREIIPDVAEKFHQFQRMAVVDRTMTEGYEIEKAVDFIEGVKKELKSLLVVMNTKKMTREIYEALRKRMDRETKVLYLTTELCPAHRSNVIFQMKTLLKEKKSMICVSTSILEAGVDVSFEGVVRNVAGLDSIAQSSGRGNRHGEQEKNGITYIINMKDEKLGSMTEIAVGEEKTKAVLDTYRRRPEAYDHSLLSPIAMRDYYQKYFGAGEIKIQMRYPLEGDSELEDLYSYFTKEGARVLTRRYKGKTGGYQWKLTYPFETAGKKFKVIDEDTVSVLVPYGKGKDIIGQIIGKSGRYSLSEMRRLLREARPFFVNLYGSKVREYQECVVASPISGVLILKDGYYDAIVGIKEEQTLEFLSL
ncbi:MAG: CRISPR-associated helicase Cas3' [Lachnospiraceae bacterium]|nr:CRISPR-associated helicase Cas3' [Lachnospiraceae bacterium]